MAYDKDKIYKRIQSALRSEIGQSLNPIKLKEISDKANKAFLIELNKIKREWDVKCKLSEEDTSKIEVTVTKK